MSATSGVLDLETALQVSEPLQIVVVDRDENEVIERLTLVRYAGHYRADAGDAFAVKDVDDKFLVRSARELGLTDDSANLAILAKAFDERAA